jgi:hypothetical protein
MEFEYKKVEVQQPPPPPVVEDRFVLSFTKEEFRALVAVSALVAGNPIESSRRLFDKIWQFGTLYGFREALYDTKVEGKITFPNSK